MGIYLLTFFLHQPGEFPLIEWDQRVEVDVGNSRFNASHFISFHFIYPPTSLTLRRHGAFILKVTFHWHYPVSGLFDTV